MINIYQASLPEDLGCVHALLRAYLECVGGQLNEPNHEPAIIEIMMSRSLSELDTYVPPDGRLLLAQYRGRSAGLVFMKKIRGDSCEIKRMYVLPELRGCGIGQSLLDHVIEEARFAGYARILLDSVKFMAQAHSLYRSRGFKQIDPYPESEMQEFLRQHLVYMSLEIGRER